MVHNLRLMSTHAGSNVFVCVHHVGSYWTNVIKTGLVMSTSGMKQRQSKDTPQLLAVTSSDEKLLFLLS